MRIKSETPQQKNHNFWSDAHLIIVIVAMRLDLVNLQLRLKKITKLSSIGKNQIGKAYSKLCSPHTRYSKQIALLQGHFCFYSRNRRTDVYLTFCILIFPTEHRFLHFCHLKLMTNKIPTRCPYSDYWK